MKSLDEYINKGSQNFSFKEDIEPEQLVTFSCADAKLESVSAYKMKDNEKGIVNFSAVQEKSTEDVMECFSVGFMQFYLEETRPARDSLKRRIQQVVNFIKGKGEDTLSKPSVKRAMRKYIYMFILQKIQNYITMLSKGQEDDSKNSANLMVALGIGPYLSDRKAIGRLQMTLKMLAPQLKKDGTMQKPIQLKIKQAFSSVFTDILRTIEKKFLPEEKRGFLTNVKSSDSGKAETKVEKPALKK